MATIARKLGLSLLALVALTGAKPAGFEAEPTLPTRSLAGGSLALAGEGYRIDERTLVESFMGRFRIHTAVGTIDAVGVDELERRVAEVPAITQLMAMERSDVFAGAMKASADRSVDAARRIVTEPGQTLAALPAGVGRAILGAGRKVRRVAVDVADAAARQNEEVESTPRNGGDVKAPPAANPLPDFARELAGVNKARRAIAARLGMDPYPRTPAVAEKLESLAWATVAGGLSLDLALAAIPGGFRNVVGAAREVDDLAWKLPPADIQRQLETRLRARGHAPRAAREWLRNRAFTPTEQLAFVGLVESLDVAGGEGDLLVTATEVRTPGHARFLLGQLRMLDRNPQRARYAAYATSGGVAWISLQDGSQVLALPLDHLAWTEQLGGGMPASLRPDPRRGRILLAGSASPMARDRLAKLGWLLQEKQRVR